MTASNPAVGAWPGWRGTDAKGGTWWRVGGHLAESFQPWLSTGEEVTDDLVWRTQEEAEAAGLVAVVPQTHVDDLMAAMAAHREHITELREQRDEARSQAAPLDPGNPKDCRTVRDFLGRFDPCLQTVHVTMKRLDDEADRIEREAAEKAQDESDRAAVRAILAERTPKEIGIPFDHTGVADQNRTIERALVFFRAGRAAGEAK